MSKRRKLSAKFKRGPSFGHKKARIQGGLSFCNALFLKWNLVATGGLEPPTPAL